MRQFAGDQLAATGTIGDAPARPGRFVADRSIAGGQQWLRPRNGDAYRRYDAKRVNRRTAF